jgi:hypothetical protein
MTKRPARMPTVETVQQWIRDDHDGFAARYERARRIGCATVVDQIFETADLALDSLVTPGAIDREYICGALLRIEQRCVSLAELLPGIDDVQPAAKLDNSSQGPIDIGAGSTDHRLDQMQGGRRFRCANPRDATFFLVHQKNGPPKRAVFLIQSRSS